MTQDLLKEFFKYDSSTGKFYKIKKSGLKGSIGDDITHITDSGYYLTQLLGKKYRAHHLAWLYVYGYLPERLDHINGDKLDNRIDNLREVTNQENLKNSKRFSTNTSGFTGISKYKDKWRAYIVVDGKQKHLGVFDDIEEAKQARLSANITYGYHQNHGRVK